MRRQVCAARDDDLVLARRIDGDHGGAGRPVGGGDTRDVHARRLQHLAHQPPEVIVADVAHHAHDGAGPGRGRRLVRALAAGGELVARAEHGLAGPGQRLHPEQQVEVERAEDEQHREHPRPD